MATKKKAGKIQTVTNTDLTISNPYDTAKVVEALNTHYDQKKLINKVRLNLPPRPEEVARIRARAEQEQREQEEARKEEKREGLLSSGIKWLATGAGLLRDRTVNFGLAIATADPGKKWMAVGAVILVGAIVNFGLAISTGGVGNVLAGVVCLLSGGSIMRNAKKQMDNARENEPAVAQPLNTGYQPPMAQQLSQTSIPVAQPVESQQPIVFVYQNTQQRNNDDTISRLNEAHHRWKMFNLSLEPLRIYLNMRR